MKFLDLVGVSTLVDEIKARFVQKTSGKDLSTNDFTNVLRTKLENIEDGAEKNRIELIKKNGLNLSIGVDGSVDVAVPTKLSDLTDDIDVMSRTDITAAIQEQARVKKEIVTELPDVSAGQEGMIYFVPADIGYAEYMLINSQWEKIGETQTEVDLTGYVKETDIQTITNLEITNAFDAI